MQNCGAAGWWEQWAESWGCHMLSSPSSDTAFTWLGGFVILYLLHEGQGKLEQSHSEAGSQGFSLLFMHGSAARESKTMQMVNSWWRELKEVHLQGRVRYLHIAWQHLVLCAKSESLWPLRMETSTGKTKQPPACIRLPWGTQSP